MSDNQLLTIVAAIFFRVRDVNPPHGILESRDAATARAVEEAKALVAAVKRDRRALGNGDSKATATDRILAFVRAHPGRTAWEIAKELSTEPNRDKVSVSSFLCRFAKDGRLQRERNHRGSWTYSARKA